MPDNPRAWDDASVDLICAAGKGNKIISLVVVAGEMPETNYVRWW